MTEESLEQHRQKMIDHFVMMFKVDPDYSRHAVGVYARTPDAPFPKIGQDVRARLIELGLIEDKTRG